MQQNRTYHEFADQTVGDSWSSGVGEQRVAIASPDGSITLADKSGLETLTVDRSVDDVTLQRYVLVLSDETLASYTDSGVELWTRTVEGATTLVSIETEGIIVVLTGDGRAVGLDVETGSEVFDVAQPHDDFDDVIAVSGPDFCCLATWSFVSCLKGAGTVTVDENLDSTVEAVAVLDDIIIAALQDGVAVGIDPATGTQRWQSSMAIHAMAPRGTEETVAATDSGTIRLTAAGRIEETNVPAGDRLVEPTDGSIVAVADGQSVSFYRHGPPPAETLDVNLLTERILGTGPVRAYVANEHETRTETTLSVETSPAVPLESSHETVALEPEESREVAFRLTEPPAVEETDWEVTVDGKPVESETLPVEQTLDASSAVEVTTSLDQYGGDVAVYSCTVTNTSGRKVDCIAIEDGTDQRHVPAGEEVSTTLSVPRERERTVTVTVEQWGETDTVKSSLTVPKSLVSGTVERGSSDATPTVDIVLTPTEEIAVSGTVSVTVADEMRVERQLDLSRADRLVLAIPLPLAIASRPTIPVTVRSSLLEEKLTARVDGWDEAKNRRTSQQVETTAERPVQTPEQTTNPNPEPRQEGRSASSPSRKPEPTAGKNQEKRKAGRDGMTGEPALDIERSVPGRVERSATFTETVRVTNAGSAPVSSVSVQDCAETWSTARLDPGETVTLARRHTVLSDDLRLPPIEARAEGNRGEGVTAGGKQIAVVDPTIEMQGRGVLKEEQAHFTITVANHGGRPCRIDRFAIDISRDDGAETWKPDSQRVVEPGTQTEVETTLSVRDGEVTVGDRRRVGMRFEFPDTSPKKQDTLVPITEQTGGGPFSGELTGKTQFVANKPGVVEVELTNESGTRLTDLTLAAEGSVIEETPMSPDSKTVPALDDGEVVTLLADVRPDSADQARFEVHVAGQRGEETIDHQLEFIGPVAPSKEMWDTDGFHAEWEMQTEDATGESHLVTDFQPTEAGSRR